MMCAKKFSPNKANSSKRSLKQSALRFHRPRVYLKSTFFSPLCKVEIFRHNKSNTRRKEDFVVESKFSTERGGEFLDAHEEEEEEEYEDGIHGRRPGGEHRDVED